VRGYGGSNKSFSVARNPVREEQSLQMEREPLATTAERASVLEFPTTQGK